MKYNSREKIKSALRICSSYCITVFRNNFSLSCYDKIFYSLSCYVFNGPNSIGRCRSFCFFRGKKTEVETKEVKIKDEIRPSLEGNDPVKVAESFPKRRAALESLSSQSSIGNLCAISNFLDSQMLSRNFSKEIWGSTIFTRSKSTCDAEGSEPFRYTACGYLAGLRSKLAGSYELGVTAGLLQGRLKDVSDSHRTRATSSILSVHGSMVTRPLSCTKYIVGKARPLLFFFRLTSDVRRDLKKKFRLEFCKD
ncbi:hypothetical protein CpB1093 [Chlamydia pneumoniae TW-183]|uniref:Uncharacterized protein n=2 Tax=Chlamydia pneumoniae TaxID=83558 RepID=Q9Z6K7_CHLPN|nr:hypothetical protein CPn_1052 [Chlamydia pneumoniae CWL029]AAF38599.1 hypothetical protein CP_0800 [Chlamydia pneumoniae AR39]AAP99022.1 hypothetical protein CpB1093 [Chlamydia pneumoniae TW-183]CRI33594.1 Uncharacterized protein BN1224_Wien1_A_11010 [Chlamydia pneumoniae]BAA99259.1 hypothetical protein [Chlamydia pneumoniae J138]